MRKQEKHKQIRVVHIMADGRVRDSVEGYPVPVNDITRPAYNILAAMAVRSAVSNRHSDASVRIPGEENDALGSCENQPSAGSNQKKV